MAQTQAMSPTSSGSEHSGRSAQQAAPAGTSFASLGVAVEITEALASRDIRTAFAIQEYTLPLALAGKDIIGQARTGMGKTLGFGIPLLDRVFDDAALPPADGTPRALVVVPTRELCIQVAEDLSLAGAGLSIPESPESDTATSRQLRIVSLYGGIDFSKQIPEIKKGADVIVGTPGRLLDLSRQGELDLSTVRIVVLDEADEMLDQGFIEDVEDILNQTHDERQTLLFSATMPGPIMALSRKFMNHPVLVQADDAPTAATHANTTQIAFLAHRLDRVSLLARILQTPDRGRTIVFVRTKRQAARLALDLAKLGFAVGAVHGDMKQRDRELSLDDFRNGDVDVMVATDVAARGIDVSNVTHVVNFQIPDEERTYVHRIGRTGRAGHSGVAVTLVDWDDANRWTAISEALSLGMDSPPQWFSQSPEFLEAFGLPEDISDSVGPAREVRGSAAATAPARRNSGGRSSRSAQPSRSSRSARQNR